MKEIHLTIKAIQNAPRTEIVGLMENGVVRIKVHSIPEKGKANQELIRFLAEAFEIKKEDVILTSGAASRLKYFKIVGKDQDDLQRFLEVIKR